MLPHSRSAPPPLPPRRCGVGIDTSRYGHYAVFLRDDLQPADAELAFAESGPGYARLRGRLERLAQRHTPCAFCVRVDAAGQYADNLLAFFHDLAQRGPWPLTVSCGDPQRNKNYRAAVFGSQKSDPVEARAAARYVLTEQPKSDPPWSRELRTLRQVAGRLQAVVRQRTRLLNQLHHLVAVTFPELGLLVRDLSAGWVLELLHRYPTAPRLAAAADADLAAIAYLPQAQRAPLSEQARGSIAALHGPLAEELVRDQVRQLRDVGARQKRLETLLVDAYHALPEDNHLATLPGIGDVTAAVLTAFIRDIGRFATPSQLVAYFGTLPIEVSSGVDRQGQPRGPKRYVMSRRGNDLVRRYLWLAALSAVRCNPAVRALYARVSARHPNRRAVALGHAMRKLLHLAWALWKTVKPFDPQHYPWQAPEGSDSPLSCEEEAAGRKPDAPAGSAVTATSPAIVGDRATRGESLPIDFAHLKR
ncbi:MAG TPA: IS110 family transposase, partial [Gemmataceae bacterium]|nr:IS110 family transposase [Gemmataceae bacterium]